jgi:hypothetical protein
VSPSEHPPVGGRGAVVDESSPPVNNASTSRTRHEMAL